METFFIMLKNVIIFVLLAVPGFLLIKGKILKPSESGVLSKILTNLGLPALVFANTISLEFTSDFLKSMVVFVALCVVFHMFSYFVIGPLCRGEKEKRAMGVCQKKIQERKLDMKLVDVEYSFDNSKILFY